MKAATGRFQRAREGRADHHGVGAGDQRLAEVAAGADAAVGDDGDVASGALVVDIAGVGALDGCRDLRHADAQHLARGAGRARPDADQQSGDAFIHQLQRGLEADCVADQRGDIHLVDQFAQNQSALGAGVMARGGYGRLHDEHIGRGVLDRGGELLSVGRRDRNRGRDAAVLDLLHPAADQFSPNRRRVGTLQNLGRGLGVAAGDFLQHLNRIVEAALEALQIEHGHPAAPSHLNREMRVDHGVHRRGEDRDLQPLSGQHDRDIGEFGIDGHDAGHDRHVVEAVGLGQRLASRLGHRLDAGFVGALHQLLSGSQRFVLRQRGHPSPFRCWVGDPALNA